METNKLKYLVERNIKCYFKDKFLFFVSMLTPLILLVLFITFLRKVYVDSVTDAISATNVEIDFRVINGFVAAWLLSSILAVSSVTVAFASNTIMIQDKISNSIIDFLVSPVKKTTLLLSYFIATFIVTLLVMLGVMLIGFIYIGIVGWYIRFVDIVFIFLGVIIAVLFGTSLAVLIGSFIDSEGLSSAVTALISALYGFICGAYMPLAQFSEGVRKVLAFFPGTSTTVLLRQACLSGYFIEMENAGIPSMAIDSLKTAFDYSLVVNNYKFTQSLMYGISIGAVLILILLYLLRLRFNKKRG